LAQKVATYVEDFSERLRRETEKAGLAARLFHQVARK
jgi:hypothetical protein